MKYLRFQLNTLFLVTLAFLLVLARVKGSISVKREGDIISSISQIGFSEDNGQIILFSQSKRQVYQANLDCSGVSREIRLPKEFLIHPNHELIEFFLAINGESLLRVFENGKVLVCDLQTLEVTSFAYPESIQRLAPNMELKALAFACNGDGSLLGAVHGSTISIMNATDKSIIQTINIDPNSRIYDFDISGNGQVAAVRTNKDIQIWSISSGDLVAQIPAALSSSMNFKGLMSLSWNGNRVSCVYEIPTNKFGTAVRYFAALYRLNQYPPVFFMEFYPGREEYRIQIGPANQVFVSNPSHLHSKFSVSIPLNNNWSNCHSIDQVSAVFFGESEKYALIQRSSGPTAMLNIYDLKLNKIIGAIELGRGRQLVKFANYGLVGIFIAFLFRGSLLRTS